MPDDVPTPNENHSLTLTLADTDAATYYGGLRSDGVFKLSRDSAIRRLSGAAPNLAWPISSSFSLRPFRVSLAAFAVKSFDVCNHPKRKSIYSLVIINSGFISKLL